MAVGVLLFELYRQFTQAQVHHAEAVVARSCVLIRDRYSVYVSGWTGPVPKLPDDRLHADLTNVVSLALARQDGIEGGIWQADTGPLAYAYPTYEGTGPKTDLPAAERDQIQAVNQRAARDEQPIDQHAAARTQTLLLHACPLNGPISGLTAWTMTRVNAAQGLRPFQLRALQECVVTPVGGRPMPIEVRVTAATHRDLIKAIRDGRRDRLADIIPLAAHFLALFVEGGAPKRLGADASSRSIRRGPAFL